MEMMGQGLVLMIFGMGFVYLFLWLMIVVHYHPIDTTNRLPRQRQVRYHT